MNALANAARIKIGNRTFPFTCPEDASAAYRGTIDRLGLGASETPPCHIVDGHGNVVGYVSYNGRVWSGHPHNWHVDAKPIYDNRAVA